MDEMEPMMDAPMEEAPMMMEESKEEPQQVSTCLAVLASQDDDVQLFDKIISSSAYTENSESKKFNVLTTTYEEFLDGKKQDTFDFVILVFMRAASSDDLEMKQDYYDYYTQVPLVHYAFAKKEQDNDELAGVKKYLKEKCDKRLHSGEPLVFTDLSDSASCAENLITQLNQLHERKEEIFE